MYIASILLLFDDDGNKESIIEAEEGRQRARDWILGFWKGVGQRKVSTWTATPAQMDVKLYQLVSGLAGDDINGDVGSQQLLLSSYSFFNSLPLHQGF
jgi:hypothetical protein